MAPNRAEFQEQLAKEFLSCLEEKGLEWKKGWDTVGMAPMNAATGKRYHGINQFYLGLLALQRGYTDPRWATMVQIMDKDGRYHPGQKWHLQKGSKAAWVEFWYPFDAEARKAVSWAEYRQLPREEQEKFQFRFKPTPVFHASMIDGLEPMRAQQREPQELDEVVGRLSASMGVELLYDGGKQAFYRPSEDKIHLPDRTAFRDSYELNATALHELTHATGHPNRLNRSMGGGFGSPEYAYEELVAEIGSCLMSAGLYVPQTAAHIENHKAYVSSWISDIREKPEMLTAAIKEAQAAVGYMEYYAGIGLEQQRMTEQKEMAAQEKPGPGSGVREQQPAPQRAAAATPARKAPPQEQPWSPVTRSGKLHYTDDQYKIAREASALEYARRQGYRLVKDGARYHLADHDSMIFLPNGWWNWNSHALHGRALDFITKYEGKSLPEAVLILNGIDYTREGPQQPAQSAPYAPTKADLAAAATRPEFALPPRAERMNRLFSYLCATRGLDYQLVRELVSEGRVYESVNRLPDGGEVHNAVFVGFDQEGTARSAFLRGCSEKSSFKREQPGSDKSFPFLIPGRQDCDKLYVFEAAIDAASHATLYTLAGLDTLDGHRVALGGNAPKEAIPNILAAYPGIKTVCLCTDNDAAGGSIAGKLKEQLEERGMPSGSIQFQTVPLGKDWNVYLQTWRSTVAHHRSHPTTSLDGGPGPVCGRIHYLNRDGGVEITMAYTDLERFGSVASAQMQRQAPCVVETRAQLEELARLEQRRQARQQAHGGTGRQADGKPPDYLVADGEPDLDKEISRDRHGFRDRDPKGPEQRTGMEEQLAGAMQEARQRNIQRQCGNQDRGEMMLCT